MQPASIYCCQMIESLRGSAGAGHFEAVKPLFFGFSRIIGELNRSNGGSAYLVVFPWDSPFGKSAAEPAESLYGGRSGATTDPEPPTWRFRGPLHSFCTEITPEIARHERALHRPCFVVDVRYGRQRLGMVCRLVSARHLVSCGVGCQGNVMRCMARGKQRRGKWNGLPRTDGWGKTRSRSVPFVTGTVPQDRWWLREVMIRKLLIAYRVLGELRHRLNLNQLGGFGSCLDHGSVPRSAGRHRLRPVQNVNGVLRAFPPPGNP